MTIAAAIFLIAVGAILRYATDLDVEGVSIDTVGLILMIAGAAGLLLSFIQEAFLSGRARRREAEAQERAAADPQIAAEQRAAEERREPPPPSY
jgi:Domain of unknown function (DUF6458)